MVAQVLTVFPQKQVQALRHGLKTETEAAKFQPIVQGTVGFRRLANFDQHYREVFENNREAESNKLIAEGKKQGKSPKTTSQTKSSSSCTSSSTSNTLCTNNFRQLSFKLQTKFSNLNFKLMDWRHSHSSCRKSTWLCMTRTTRSWTNINTIKT